MINTIGAFLFATYPTFTLSNIGTTANIPKNTSIKKSPVEIVDDAYKQDPMLLAIVEHYNTKSEWAGTFKIGGVIKSRIEETSGNEIIAHVSYRYIPIPNNAQGRVDRGFDQRVFTLIKNGDDYQVLKMGAYKSGKF